MKKIILLLFLLCIVHNVKAVYFYYGDELIPNMYMVRDSGNEAASAVVYVAKKNDTKEFAYCLEPLILLNMDSNYTEYNSNNAIFNLSSETLKKINTIAYYGYKYPGHDDNTWYGVTQYLIWKTIFPTYNFYFTDTRFGNKVNWYDDKISELNNLVNKELEGFNFKNRYDLKTGEEYTIIDNDLLKEYDIVNYNNLDIKIENNKLIVKSNKDGTYHLQLRHKNWRNQNYYLYHSNDAQDLFINGLLDIKYNLVFYFRNVKLTVYKEDSNPLEYSNITTDGAIYNLYDKDHNIVATKTIKDGKMEFELPFGKYYLEELEPSYGYLKDNKKKTIIVTDNMDYTVYEEKIFKPLYIHKQYLDNDTLYDEENAIFELYSRDYLIDTLTTNEHGLIEYYLPYGEYSLKQVRGIDGYILADIIDFKVDDEFDGNISITNFKEVVEEPIIEIKKEVLGENIVILKYEVPDTFINYDTACYPIFKIIKLLFYVFKKIYL